MNTAPSSPKAAWDLILKATSPLASSEVESVRVQLWLTAFSHGQPRTMARFQSALASALNLARSWAAPVPDVTPGRYLFCIPFASPAMLGNILPLAMRALENRCLGGIIAGKSCVAYLGAFEKHVPVITHRELMSAAGLAERIEANHFAQSALLDLIAATELEFPFLASRLKQEQAMWRNEIAFTRLMHKMFKNYLLRWRPSIVVSPSDFFSLEASLIRQANQVNIPTTVIQHGLVDPFWWPFSADYDLLWGDAFMREMTVLGAPMHRLYAAGMISSDPLFRRYADRTFAEPSSASPVVLLISNTHAECLEPEIYARYSDLLQEIVPAVPSVRWIVKLHPCEPEDFYRRLPTPLQARLQILPRTISLEDAVKRADIACTVNSTAGLECMIMQKPLIVFDTAPSVRTVIWWPLHQGGTYINSTAAFVSYISDFIAGPDFIQAVLERQRAFLASAFANPGHATKKSFEFIRQTASSAI